MANTMNIEQSIETLCETLTNQWSEKHGFCSDVLSYTKGRKYFKLIKIDDRNSQRSVFCFIDKEGAVYKPASWQSPAKGKRWHLEHLTSNPQLCDMFGSFLYKR